MLLLCCRPSSGRILEALHVDPASGISLEKEKHCKVLKPSVRYFVVSGSKFIIFLSEFLFSNIGLVDMHVYGASLVIGLLYAYCLFWLGIPVLSYYSANPDGLLNSFVYFYGSTSSGLSKLSKPTTIGGPSKQQGERKETPQERLKRIMSKQLNKQSIC